MKGWERPDGRKGIRNVIVVAYLVECAHHVAREITIPWRDQDVHLIGFPGCYANQYAYNMMERLSTHPNVGGVVLVSLGCEGFNKRSLQRAVSASGRPVETLIIQGDGGTRSTIEKGRAIVEKMRAVLDEQPTVHVDLSELVVGTICGGSDGASGITANPAVGRAFDSLVAEGATCVFEETGELIGCEGHMASRAITVELADEITRSVGKAARYYETLGHGSFAPGNAEGGLTTQEEKSMGAYAKSGSSQISGLIKPGDQPPSGGLFLLDVVPDGEVRFGFPNIADNAEIVELIACGCQLIIFTTGRGSVVGSAISPVIKVCSNSDTYNRLAEDMDVNAGTVLDGTRTLDEVGKEILDAVTFVASGGKSRSEELGHQEFILTYKSFEPVGPACLPTSRITAHHKAAE
ncbi:UxaA family hydrolase [Aquisalinus flavus]|uniref:Hydrolase n=1 Tax=Aquisalinus flavus TaxID=1526572 RepID=A0A8J2V6Y9_9PROT|nr:UxaA family hydrolase [Aquisalinus flavus]MBD0426007.1 UxaA family hydrolase [Aquisalinus flavus]UNE48401.1 hydrolase [Aquisalinus flavus]GGD11467.1 hydrolase [Aquisalinus flavus]